MNEIVAAFLSNISYAIADNVNGFVAKKNKPLKLAFWVCLIGTLLFFLPAIIFFGHEIQRLTILNVITMLAINVLVNIGYFSFVSAMNKGSVTLTGIIGGSFPAVTTIVALIVFHEQITFYQAVFILLILIGIILSSMNVPVKELFQRSKTSGILFALSAFFFWGVYFALVRIPIKEIGWFLPQYTSSIVGLLMFYLVALVTKDRDLLTLPKLPLLLILLDFLQVGGSVLFSYAISIGQTAIVAPIAGSSPAVFVVIAYFLFKEKLNKKQWLGIISAIIGIIGLSLAS